MNHIQFIYTGILLMKMYLLREIDSELICKMQSSTISLIGRAYGNLLNFIATSAYITALCGHRTK